MKNGLFTPVDKKELNMYSPLALAYMGDAAFEVLVRRYISAKKNMPPAKLHKEAKGYVTADRQSGFLDLLWDHLTPDEQELCRRGRNAKPKTVSKSATACEYMKATALETLFGFLHLAGEESREEELFCLITDWCERQEEEKK